MRFRTLIIVVVVLSLLVIAAPASALTPAASTNVDPPASAETQPTLSVAADEILNILPEGFHDAFAGTQSPFFCRAEGWAADPDDRSVDLNIRVFSDGAAMAQTVADTFRQDLADAGVCTDGTCSFSVNLWGVISPDVDHLITVQAQDAQTGEWSNLYDTPKTLKCFTPQAGTFIVNSTGDRADANPADGVCETFTPGECTLRAAITEANASPGMDTISFNIPGAGSHTISPSYGLDFISDPVIIDGTTQPNFAGTPIIELDGSGAGAGTGGLTIIAGSTTVRGLVINRFDGYGIRLDQKGNNLVQGNFIGTDVSGTVALGNNGDGIVFGEGGNNSVIGGTTAGAGNVISGNGGNGVSIYDGATGNMVEGDYIGTDVAGSASLGNAGNGVTIAGGSAGNTIGGATGAARNLISGNNGSGIVIIDLGSTGNVVQGNYIGSDVSGSTAIANNSNGIGIYSGAANNLIGGTTGAAGNLISGNIGSGVTICCEGATANLVQGNYIGTDAMGASALGNSGDGVNIDTSTNNVIGGTAPGARNLISGNNGNGVTIINVESTGNLVQGNFIGTDSTGTTAVGNADDGVVLVAPNNKIGGTTSAARNVISGNQEQGVRLQGSEATGNIVQGNFIGLDRTGTVALGNGTDCCHSGVVLHLGASNNTIGGNVPDAGNVISGNTADGVTIMDAGTTGNVVAGNLIGTDLTGTVNVANAFNGIDIFDGASDNIIGGTTSGAGNSIAFNNDNGVVLAMSSGSGNGILSNSIYSNGNLGIDLGQDGVTGIDLFDADSGPNSLQNAPVITMVKSTSKGTVIQGVLISSANATFHLEFFSNNTCDPSGYGEGQTYLGSVTVNTNTTGHVNFRATLPVALSAGNFVTATVTDPANNTSEFSRCMTVST